MCDDDDEDCDSTFSLRSCEGDDCGLGLFWSGRPVLGVELVEVTKELREPLGGSRDAGVLISKIVSGTPAERADLEVGDLIMFVAGDSVKNTRDLRRALRDKRGETADFVGRLPTPSQAAIAGELKERARHALDELPPDYREIIRLVQEEELTMAEAAARMERSRDAVKQLYGRALSHYAKLLDVTHRRRQ